LTRAPIHIQHIVPVELLHALAVGAGVMVKVVPFLAACAPVLQVGYSIRFEDCTSEKTVIKWVAAP
jgi:hypothetical protein